LAGRSAEALALLEDLARRNPTAEIRRHLAAAQFEAGRLDEGLRNAREYLSAAPDDLQAHELVGLCLVRLGRGQEAWEEIERAMQSAPESAGVLLNAAKIAYEGLRDSARARELLDRSLRLDPRNADAWFTRGVLAAFDQDAESAVEAFREAYRLEPSLEHAAALAQGLVRTDRAGEAVRVLGEAIRRERRGIPDDVLLLLEEARRRAGEEF
jgi:tetratricopeptide (TPR) repeat protein